MNEDYYELESELGAKWRSLGGFLDQNNRLFDREEQMALNPILQSLRKETQHYIDRELVGEGGEKRIFKVRDTRTDRIVAMARPRTRATDEEKEEFLREARLTACLQHPNILTIHDQGVDEEGVPYFIMEFVRGDDLQEIVSQLKKDDRVYRERYSQERLLEIFIKVCDAVSYAHSRGVAHLDLKPANIKVGPFGEVQLCDWGISRILTPGFDALLENRGSTEEFPNSDLLNDLSPSGLAKGTPGFIAPEQADGSFAVNERTDVYSLGSILYYVLSYRAPISGKTSKEILEKTVQGRIDPIEKESRGRLFPKRLEAVAMKAMSVDPESRYRSVTELREELDLYLLGFPTKAQKAGPITKLEYLFKRRPAVFFVSGFSAVLLIFALVISSVQIEQSRREAVEARDLAEGNLRLYVEEMERSRQLDERMRLATLGFHNQETFLDAAGKESLLKFQLEEGNRSIEERREMALRLAMLHFVRQKFDEAVNAFEETGERIEDNLFYAIASKYQVLAPGKNRWLNPYDVKDILLEIPPRYDDVCYALAFYYFRGSLAKGDPEDLLRVIEVLLDRLNHRGRDEEMLHTLSLGDSPRGLSLSLTGKTYSSLHLPIPVFKESSNLLNALGLYALDIRGSSISDLTQLKGSGIRELNMSGISRVPMSQVIGLRELDLDRLIHSLEIPDDRLREYLPTVELVRDEQ
jgi:serine/threonine protein kinase